MVFGNYWFEPCAQSEGESRGEIECWSEDSEECEALDMPEVWLAFRPCSCVMGGKLRAGGSCCKCTASVPLTGTSTMVPKGEAVLLLMGPGLGSCFERKGLYLAVVAAVGHRLVASVGVGGAETVDYARVVVVVVARRKCVPPAAAAFAVVADSTARHSQDLHL